MSMTSSFVGKVAFAREGACVVAADVSEQGNQETARLVEKQGGACLPSGATSRGHTRRARQDDWGSAGRADGQARGDRRGRHLAMFGRGAFMIGHAMVIDGGQTMQ